ncbi:MAG: hypothetical protein OEW08_13835 [Gammaproteobacteria bacterium]|nr:hypothetical protein [Gammaproteobacteria bacterium]
MVAVTDNFNGTNGTTLQTHVADTGESWTRSPGQSIDVTLDGAGALAKINWTKYHSSWAPATAEYDVTVVVLRYVSSIHAIDGPAGRVSTTVDTDYHFNGYGGVFYLRRQVNGGGTDLASYTAGVDGNPTTCKLEIRDAAKKGFINGVERLTSADNTITAAGFAGIQFTSDELSHVDSFTADNPPSGGSPVSRTLNGELESLTKTAQSKIASVESGLTVSRQSSVVLEIEAALSQATLGSMEVLAALTQQRVVALESPSGLVSVSRSIAVAAEALQSLRQARTGSIAVLQGLRVSASGNLEAVSTVLMLRAVAIEVGLLTAQTGAATLEATMMLSRVSGVAIEFIGAGIFPSYEALTLALRDAESVALVLKGVEAINLTLTSVEAIH